MCERRVQSARVKLGHVSTLEHRQVRIEIREILCDARSLLQMSPLPGRVARPAEAGGESGVQARARARILDRLGDLTSDLEELRRLRE